MLKIKDDIDLKELEKFGYKIIPEGIYAKSTKCFINTLGDKTEYFITVEKNRTLKKYKVESYLFKVYKQQELHLWKKDIKDLIKADLVEKVNT